MGCFQSTLLTASAELELRNAGVVSRSHLQALSSIAQDLLGDSYRTDVIRKAQEEGKEELELSTRPDDRARSQAFKCANIVDMRKFENDNVLSWLKVRQENEIRREQLGADEIRRESGAGVQLGFATSPTDVLSSGGIPIPKASINFSREESAGDVANRTVIELTTHVLSFKDAFSPENNIHSLKEDVRKVDSVLQSWANPDPKYGELYVESVHCGGRLIIEYRSTQGLGAVGRRRKQSDDSVRKMLDAEDPKDNFSFPSQQKTKFIKSDNDDSSGHAEEEDSKESGVDENSNESSGGEAAVRSIGGGFSFDPASGTIKFNGQASTSDDDWEFTIKVEGGDHSSFDKKAIFRGKKGLEQLNVAQKKWIKSVKSGKTPACIWMELNRVRYLAAAVATNPKKVKEHLDRIASILDQQAKKIAIISAENDKLRSKSASKDDLIMLLKKQEQEKSEKAKNEPKETASSNNRSTAVSPKRKRKLSEREQHLHNKFQASLHRLNEENARLTESQASESIEQIERHQASMNAIAFELENEFAELMSELILEHETKLKNISNNEGTSQGGANSSAHDRFAAKMRRVKTITQSALKKHRSLVRHIKEDAGKMEADLSFARTRLGNKYGADGIEASSTDKANRMRKELKRPVTVFSRFRPFRANVGELIDPNDSPVYNIENINDSNGEEVSKLKLNISKEKEYTLDYVFDDNSIDSVGRNMQEYVFKNSAALLVPKMLAGYNVTLMAYGQTGSGGST